MINFVSPRKYSLPFNIVLFNLCRLWPFRSKKIWIFGAWEGKKYDDNSKYMIQYVKNIHGNRIRTIWLTNNLDALNRTRKEGIESYLNGSIKGKWFQLRAGVSIYTNGLIDFGVFPLVGGSTVVALWHGMSFKRIYNGTYKGAALIAKKILDKVFSWTYRNITIVTSEYSAKWCAKMFTLNKKLIYATGQPRNDAFKNLERSKVLQNTTISPTKKIILYMPTYRMPSMGEDAMTRIVENLYNDRNLSQMLDVSNSVFVAKLHPLTPHIDLKNRDNFVILDFAAVDNNQDLLGIADCLVTDYSSCFIDYALLRRPIIFYTPDEDLFFKNSEKVEKEFFDIERLCQATNPKSLKDALESSSTTVADATNELFEDKSICGTCYSENVYKVICKEIGI